MKIRRRQITLTVLAVVLLLAGLTVWSLHYRPKRAVAEYKRQLVAAGEKLTVAELIPPPVPQEQDGTAVFLKAVALLNTPTTLLHTNYPVAMRMVAPGKAMVGWRQSEFRDDYLNVKCTNTWAEAESALAEISAALELLHELTEKPRLDFKINYQQGFNVMLPNLGKTKMATQRLSVAALSDLHRGDPAAAVKNIRAMLALSQGTTDERLFISQLVRIAITAITVAANWELLQSPGLADEQLAVIQRDWSKLEFIQAVENALAMERAMGEMSVAQMRNSSAGFNKVVSGYALGGVLNPPDSPNSWYEEVEQFAKDSWDKTRIKTKETAWRVAWSYPDQLRALKGDQVLLETVRAVRTNESFDAALRLQQNRLDAIGIREISDDDMFSMVPGDLDLRSLLSQSVLSLHKVLTRVMTIETSRQLMVTAIALKRYHLRHGNYPPALAALTPEFLPAVPRDPVDSQPLRYRANPDGTFMLYSVGENAQDDGGDATSVNTNSASFAWQRGRDWVWPQPASVAEAGAYYKALAKKNSSTPPGSSLNALTPEERAAFEARYGQPAPTTVSTNAPATNAIP